MTMQITHKIALDMMRPEIPPRIQVKQGDSMTRALEITLFCDGEPWIISGDVTPLVRWRACDPGTGETVCGIYDTLPNGIHAWNYTQNQLVLILAPQMFSLPGLVQADVVLVNGEKTLATFNFEFYVNQAPANGTEPQALNYYKVATLEQINQAIAALQEWQADADRLMAYLEHEIYELKRQVNEL
jgi:hypothetical protein